MLLTRHGDGEITPSGSPPARIAAGLVSGSALTAFFCLPLVFMAGVVALCGGHVALGEGWGIIGFFGALVFVMGAATNVQECDRCEYLSAECEQERAAAKAARARTRDVASIDRAEPDHAPSENPDSAMGLRRMNENGRLLEARFAESCPQHAEVP